MHTVGILIFVAVFSNGLRFAYTFNGCRDMVKEFYKQYNSQYMTVDSNDTPPIDDDKMKKYFIGDIRKRKGKIFDGYLDLLNGHKTCPKEAQTVSLTDREYAESPTSIEQLKKTIINESHDREFEDQINQMILRFKETIKTTVQEPGTIFELCNTELDSIYEAELKKSWKWIIQAFFYFNQCAAVELTLKSVKSPSTTVFGCIPISCTTFRLENGNFFFDQFLTSRQLLYSMLAKIEFNVWDAEFQAAIKKYRGLNTFDFYEDMKTDFKEVLESKGALQDFLDKWNALASRFQLYKEIWDIVSRPCRKLVDNANITTIAKSLVATITAALKAYKPNAGGARSEIEEGGIIEFNMLGDAAINRFNKISGTPKVHFFKTENPFDLYQRCDNLLDALHKAYKRRTAAIDRIE